MVKTKSLEAIARVGKGLYTGTLTASAAVGFAQGYGCMEMSGGETAAAVAGFAGAATLEGVLVRGAEDNKDLHQSEVEAGKLMLDGLGAEKFPYAGAGLWLAPILYSIGYIVGRGLRMRGY
ncbi:MAG: hypothetical protein KKD17_03115 [Nanoarchaeota archaeon]|nr:hypothetical protein [Nanoarchaeota archaeon]